MAFHSPVIYKYRVVNELTSSTRMDHALNLLSNLENMKKRKIACDFEIKMENAMAIAVHRAVLIATSKYFESLFSNELEEVQNGYFVARGLTGEGIECCTEYIYTGRIQITPSNVQSILEVAHLWQLDGLIQICLQYLRDSLSTENCLDISKLFQIYGSSKDLAASQSFVIENLHMVIETDAFLGITKDEVMYYLKSSQLTPDIFWQATITWAAANEPEKRRFLPDAVATLLEQNELSGTFLIKNVWKHAFVQENKQAKDLVLQVLSVNEDSFEREIDMSTAFALKKIIKENKLSNAEHLEAVADKYLILHFVQATRKAEFCELSLEDLKGFLSSERLNCAKELLKWKAVLKWAKHARRNDGDLPELMRLIKFEEMSKEDIKANVLDEPLVKRSEKCKGIILQTRSATVASIPVPLEQQETTYATATPIPVPLRQQETPAHAHPATMVMLDDGTGILTALDVENGNHYKIKNAPNFQQGDFLKIASIQGNLYLLKNRKLYQCSKTIWKIRAVLHEDPEPSAQLVTFQDHIYIIGKNKMSRYNPSKDTWTEQLPGCGQGSDFCFAASQDLIYAFGGTFGRSNARQFDPESGRWMTAPSQNHWRYGAAAAFYKNEIFLLGGSYLKTRRTNVESYHQRYNKWSNQADMRKPRAKFAAAVYNDRLYAVGGCLDSSTVEVYNHSWNCWEVVKGEIPKPDGTISVCVCTL